MMMMEEESDEEAQQKADYDAKIRLGAATISMLEIELLVAAEKEIGFWKMANNKHRSKKGCRTSSGRRRAFDHQGAHQCIIRDHLAPDALFGKEFPLLFRLSRPRVQVLLEAFGNCDDPFYQSFRTNLFGLQGASLEAKVLLPLKVLAYGVAPHTFMDYFQMSISQAGRCCRKFTQTLPQLFGEEYSRAPSARDIAAITNLHQRVHGVEGMLGSLDCMHTYWKNCPVAWQQSFIGKEKGPTIILEAVADYNLWFWHSSYGYAGCLNDMNILNLSPLLDSLSNGTFKDMEARSGVIPFSIGQETFERTYFLTDGIYPKYSRFVRGLKEEPTFDDEIKFTAWQASARKDIERAFGVLQSKFKVVSYPIHALDTKGICATVATCIVLHNMAVSDRVMGDVNLRYDPSIDHLPPERPVSSGILPEGRNPTEAQTRRCQRVCATGLASFDSRLAATVAERDEWKVLKDGNEWSRLQCAMVKLKGSNED
jgi:hypothetical protein